MAIVRFFSLLFLIQAFIGNASLLCAKDNWISIRTRNFLLVGNTSEGNIRNVGLRFEQFRDAFSRLFNLPPDSPYSTTVVVFKNEISFRPFKPLYQGKPMNIGGVFLAGQDLNFIALNLEAGSNSPYHVIYHEYVHYLVNSTKLRFPLWLNEGLAEFYSTFEVTDGDKKILLGRTVENHILYLRENKFLPLATLLKVDRSSPDYNENSKRGIFYAESWALVHYLMLGNPQRHKEYLEFVDLQSRNQPVEESFHKAFGTDYSTLEKELRDYIHRNLYPLLNLPLEQRLQFDASAESKPLTEAEVQYYLGDLLLHSRREDVAEGYFQKALELDPNLSQAHASLGMYYLRQKQWDKARQSLAQAAASDSSHYLVHYYYASMLVDEETHGGGSSAAFSKEKAKTIRAELKKAIAMAPNFPESYGLLAYVNLTSGEELDESIPLVQKAKKLTPRREDLDFLLAQLYARKEDYKSARGLLERLTRKDSEFPEQAQALQLLEHIQSVENRRTLMAAARQEDMNADRQEIKGETRLVEAESSSHPPSISRQKPPSTSSSIPSLNLPPPAGNKAGGILTAIECSGEGIIFVLQSNGKILRFYVPDPMDILIYNETGDSRGTMTMACGPFVPPTPIVVTYKETSSSKVKSDGELKALFFGKKE